MDIYRLILICGALTATWLVQIVGLSSFRQAVQQGPPEVNVVDFEKDFTEEEATRPLVEVADERGWDVSKDFVSVDEAERLLQEHRRKQWLGLAAGIIGAALTVFLGYRLWDSWMLGVATVLCGPLAIAFGAHSAYRRG